MFTSIFFIFLFYGICLFAIWCEDGKTHIRSLSGKFSKIQLAIIVTVLTFLVMLVIYWTQQDQFIYYWDYAGYWSISINRMNAVMNNSFVENIRSLWLSINYDDYNMFLPTIISFPLSVFGYTFNNYVIICCVMFLLPSCLLQSLLLSKMIKNKSGGESPGYLLLH